MKNERKLVAAALALTMVSAVAPLSVFAEGETTKTLNSTTPSDSMTATLDVQSTYTVTIPANVALSEEKTVSKNIEVSNVMLEKGAKIKVKLEGASNTANGSNFSAKTSDGQSTAAYTIGKGTEKSGIKIGDVVAEFDKEDTEAKTITFSEATGNTYAGAHTETLTFSISVNTPETFDFTNMEGQAEYETQSDKEKIYVSEIVAGKGAKLWNYYKGYEGFDTGGIAITPKAGHTINKIELIMGSAEDAQKAQLNIYDTPTGGSVEGNTVTFEGITITSDKPSGIVPKGTNEDPIFVKQMKIYYE